MKDISILDKLFDGLKFRDATYSEKTNICTVNFLYNPESFKLNDENKLVLNEKLNSILGNFVNFSINFISKFNRFIV